MGLKANYALATGTPPPPPPTASAAAVSPSASPSAAPAPSAASSAASGALPPRDLPAMRARLALGQTAGVNPPEGVGAMTPALLAAKTKETPSGGAEPLPVEPAAFSGAASPAAGSAEPSKRTRRTKEQMAAARAEEEARALTTAAATIEAAGGVVLDALPEPAEATIHDLVRALSVLLPEGTHLTVYARGPF